MADDVLLSFRMVGNNGKPKTVPIWLGAATTLAEALAYAQAFVGPVEDLSDAYVQRAVVEFPLDISGQTKGAPDGDSYTHDGGRFTHDTVGRYAHGTWIPAIKPAYLADTEIIDDLVVSAVEAALRVGLGGLAPTDGNGNDLTALLSKKRAYRK